MVNKIVRKDAVCSRRIFRIILCFMLFKVKLHKIDLTNKTCFCCRLDGVFQAILRRKWPRYPNGSYGRRNFTPFNGIYRLQFLQSSWQKTKKRKNYFYSRTIGCARVPIFQNQISRYIHARRSGFENQFARIKSTGLVQKPPRQMPSASQATTPTFR